MHLSIGLLIQKSMLVNAKYAMYVKHVKYAELSLTHQADVCLCCATRILQLNGFADLEVTSEPPVEVFMQLHDDKQTGKPPELVFCGIVARKPSIEGDEMVTSGRGYQDMQPQAVNVNDWLVAPNVSGGKLGGLLDDIPAKQGQISADIQRPR